MRPPNHGSVLIHALDHPPCPRFVLALLACVADANSVDSSGESALHVAELLVEGGANPNEMSDRRYTPMVFATSERMRLIVERYGAGPE